MKRASDGSATSSAAAGQEAELLTGIEDVSGRPVRRIVLRQA
jgi:hypothetical protein